MMDADDIIGSVADDAQKIRCIHQGRKRFTIKDDEHVTIDLGGIARRFAGIGLDLRHDIDKKIVYDSIGYGERMTQRMFGHYELADATSRLVFDYEYDSTNRRGFRMSYRLSTNAEGVERVLREAFPGFRRRA